MYGSIHNQLTYSISPEYFTRFKFYQFDYLDFGLPARAFVALIGFQAGWPVGALVGWFLTGYCVSLTERSGVLRSMIRGFVVVLGSSLAGLLVGALYGYVRAYRSPGEHFLGWESELQGEALQRFIVVACIHNSGYLGTLVGLAMARSLSTRRARVD